MTTHMTKRMLNTFVLPSAITEEFNLELRRHMQWAQKNENTMAILYNDNSRTLDLFVGKTALKRIGWTILSEDEGPHDVINVNEPGGSITKTNSVPKIVENESEKRKEIEEIKNEILEELKKSLNLQLLQPVKNCQNLECSQDCLQESFPSLSGSGFVQKNHIHHYQIKI